MHTLEASLITPYTLCLTRTIYLVKNFGNWYLNQLVGKSFFTEQGGAILKFETLWISLQNVVQNSTDITQLVKKTLLTLHTIKIFGNLDQTISLYKFDTMEWNQFWRSLPAYMNTQGNLLQNWFQSMVRLNSCLAWIVPNSFVGTYTRTNHMQGPDANA